MAEHEDRDETVEQAEREYYGAFSWVDRKGWQKAHVRQETRLPDEHNVMRFMTRCGQRFEPRADDTSIAYGDMDCCEECQIAILEEAEELARAQDEAAQDEAAQIDDDDPVEGEGLIPEAF